MITRNGAVQDLLAGESYGLGYAQGGTVTELRWCRSYFLFGAVLWTLSVAAPAEAVLQGRLETSPGSGVFLAYHDTDQDLSWATDAAAAALMNWADANAWAAGVTIGGIGGWRLLTVDKDGDGSVVALSACSGDPIACLDNEFAYHRIINGVSEFAPGPFSLVSGRDYWSGTFAGAGLAWEVYFGGAQGLDNAAVQMNATWPVRSGDVPLVAVVPVPALSPAGFVMLGGVLLTAAHIYGRGLRLR
jgi:hypothetical protein